LYSFVSFSAPPHLCGEKCHLNSTSANLRTSVTRPLAPKGGQGLLLIVFLCASVPPMFDFM